MYISTGNQDQQLDDFLQCENEDCNSTNSDNFVMADEFSDNSIIGGAVVHGEIVANMLWGSKAHVLLIRCVSLQWYFEIALIDHDYVFINWSDNFYSPITITFIYQSRLINYVSLLNQYYFEFPITNYDQVFIDSWLLLSSFPIKGS